MEIRYSLFIINNFLLLQLSKNNNNNKNCKKGLIRSRKTAIPLSVSLLDMFLQLCAHCKVPGKEGKESGREATNGRTSGPNYSTTFNTRY